MTKHIFDPKQPFDGNEVEWYHRFMKKNGLPIIVPKTFIYQMKIEFME